MLKDNLVYLRTKAGLSQAELGNAVGCSQQFINFCETGKKSPSLAVTKEMAKVLSCTIDDLVRDKQ